MWGVLTPVLEIFGYYGKTVYSNFVARSKIHNGPNGDNLFQMASIGEQRITVPRVVVDRVPAGDNIDTANARTIDLMARYVRQAVQDPFVRRCADFAWRKFGGRSTDPRQICWAVFWWVKHCVKFKSDERTMLEVGLDNEQDFLVNPSVLLRMRNPSEDCDGFSMLTAALLTILGVEASFGVVAVNPYDRKRWSHVFVIGHTPTGPIALDTSHGPNAGWMVPAEHIYRWQAYGALTGKPRNDIQVRHQLNGYRRPGSLARAGMGDFDDPFEGGAIGDGNTSTILFPQTGSGSGSAAGGGANWTGFLQEMMRQGVQLTSRVLTPPAYQQTVRDPATGQLISTTVRNATPATALTAGAGGMSSVPGWVWVAGGAAVLFALAASKGRNA